MWNGIESVGGRMTQLPTLTCDRDCPVCGEPVHWSRYWLRTWIWAKWACPRCKSQLGFDRKRRWLLTIPFALCGLGFEMLRSQYSFIVAFLVLTVYCIPLGFLERVTVIGNRNGRYCPSCRCDLSGTFAAGIGKCPECGRVVNDGRGNPPDA